MPSLSELLSFAHRQFFITPQLPQASFTNQTVIVTGANVGLGLEAARHFVTLGASKVIIASRSSERGEKAKMDIEKTTGKLGVVEVWSLDLQSFESVKAFAKRAEALDRLDIVCENAGVATQKFVLAEGEESTITTNVTSTFLLALLLLPALHRTAARYNTTPRLAITSSEVHAWAEFKERDCDNIFDTLSQKDIANMHERYQLSKLLEIFAVRELAPRMSQSSKPQVILNCFNPGFCHSELARELGFGMAVFKFIFARTTEVGSRTIVAAGVAGEESHGQYMCDCHVTPPSELVRSDAGEKAQKKIWAELSDKLERIQPGILANI